MSDTTKESLHKEFELERMILFSDAVFAIAITLLILEIKFPELPESYTAKSIFVFLQPTLIHFAAFIISFFFIGMSWARHLTLCKFLRSYNNTVIFYNLFLLFFIVTFPFSISAFIDNIHRDFLVAIIMYIFNIFFVTFAQYLFANYILKRNNLILVTGLEEEKQYFFLKAKYSFIMMLTAIVIMVAVALITNGNLLATGVSLYVLPVLALIMKRKLKKHKPASVVLSSGNL